MSRGLGAVERAILAQLALYRRVGPEMKIRWDVGGSFYRRFLRPREYEDDKLNRDRFERGEIVEVSRLRRELDLPKGTFSRALRRLFDKNLVAVYGADLDYLVHASTDRGLINSVGLSRMKFAALSSSGIDAVNANFVKATKSSLIDEEAADVDRAVDRVAPL